MAGEIFRQWAGNIVSGNGPFSQVMGAQRSRQQEQYNRKMKEAEFDRKLQELQLRTRSHNEVDVPNVQLRDQAQQLDTARFNRAPREAANQAIMRSLRDPTEIAGFAAGTTEAPFQPQRSGVSQTVPGQQGQGQSPALNQARTTRYEPLEPHPLNQAAAPDVYSEVPAMHERSVLRRLAESQGKEDIRVEGYKDRRRFAINNQPETAYARNMDEMDDRDLVKRYRDAKMRVAQAIADSDGKYIPEDLQAFVAELEQEIQRRPRTRRMIGAGEPNVTQGPMSTGATGTATTAADAAFEAWKRSRGQ